MDKTTVSKATLGRLPRYLQLLKELPEDEYEYVSATAIAKLLSLGEVQVRKDLAAVSGAGKPKLGYVSADLIKNLESYLCHNRLTEAVLVGAGKLGKALIDYGGFEKYGVKIIAAFDKSAVQEKNGHGTAILPMSEFEKFCKEKHIQLGIITVGKGSAQEVCDEMVNNGISAIWNFAPCKLEVPAGVLLQNEDLALSLAHLNNMLCNSCSDGI